MRHAIVVIAIAIAACVDPPSPPESPIDPSSTADQPIIGGSAVTGPTRAVVIHIPPAGLCTGILLNETTVLTAFHCIKTGLPAGTTVSHPLGPAIETADAVTSDPHPLRAFISPSPGPDWVHDIAVLHIYPPLTIPPGARDASLDDGTTTPTGSVECIGAGANYPGAPGGTLTTLTFPIIAGGTADYINLKGFPATRFDPGDSGGPCWSTTSHRIIGIIQGYHLTTFVNWITRTNGETAAWIAFQAFKTDMFDPSSSQTFAKTPAQWRTAKLDATAGVGKQIVGITSTGLEIYSGSRSGTGPISFTAAPPVSLTALPFAFATPDAAFIDVTGDGLTDLVVPSASEIDVLPAAGGKAFTFPAKTRSLGSSTWTTDFAHFGNIDGTGGKDYVWTDATGAWVGLASTSGSFGSPTKQLTWALTGAAAVDVVQLDLTLGADIGVLGSTTATTYSALGLGTISAVGIPSVVGKPLTSWQEFSGFLPVDHPIPPITIDTLDWVAVRDSALVTQLNNGAGTFLTFNSTPIEVGAGWDLASTMVDLNNDGSADWIGIDDTYVYVKPGLGTGRFGRLKMQEHGLGKVSFGSVRLADIDGDNFLDLVVIGKPTAADVTVFPFKKGSASTVFSPLTSDGVWDWDELRASMTKIAVWRTLPLDVLCGAVPCGSTTGTAGKRKRTGGGLLATAQVSAQGAPQVAVLDDGLPRTGRWRWTPDYALRATADLDGDGSDELVFADGRGIAGAGRTEDGLALVVAHSFGSAIGDPASGGTVLTADAQLAGAGDTNGDGREELLVQTSAGAVLAGLGTTGLEPRWTLGDTATTRGDTAAVQQQEQHRYAQLAVAPGTRVRAVTTGTGDADLYLRFGDAPTLTAFDCRPYTGSANETCDSAVPPGVTTAWVMVVGYTAASYHLDVTYAPVEGVVAPAGDLDRDGYADLVVATAGTWTVYRGTPQGPVPAFAAAAVLGDRVIGSDTGILVARADGIWRLTALGGARIAPWGLGLDAGSRVVPLGDLTGDGQTDFAAIAQGTLWLFGAGPNGPAVIAASGVPAGASMLAAGELDEVGGAEVVVAGAQQLIVYARSGSQLVPRMTGALGATPDQIAIVGASAQLPRTGGRRALVVQLNSVTPPE